VEEIVTIASDEGVSESRSDGFAVDVSTVPGAVVVTPAGRLDRTTTAMLRSKILTALRDAPELLVVALNRVGSIDAAGVATLIAARRRGELMGSEVRLAAPSPQASWILRKTFLDQLLPPYPTVGMALEDRAQVGRVGHLMPRLGAASRVPAPR
jgi:anti-sigma B factor antagonist